MKKNDENNEFLEILHEEMMDFHRSGYISDEEMRELDEICFGEDETSPEAENSPKEEPVTA